MTIHTAPDKEHQYKLRSCLNCIHWEQCRSGKHRAEGFVCDYAKFGCIRYDGEYRLELSFARKNDLKKSPKK